MKQTIAQFLNIQDFPFQIDDKNGNQIYLETSSGYWIKRERDSNGNVIYGENSDGNIYYNSSKSKQTCNGKIVEIEGKKYKLTEL